jgi:S1-C subfamily serine protease
VIDKERNLKNIENAHIRGNVMVNGRTKTVVEDLTGWTLYQKIVDATVSIYNGEGICSGWFVTADGWVATAAHCVLLGYTLADGKIDPADMCITVLNVNGVEGDKRVFHPSKIVVDGAGDFALMKIDGLTSQNYLEWADSSQECNGNRCFVVGNPLGYDSMSVSDGIIRDKQYITDGDTFGNYNATEDMLVSAPTFPGNSGSPIINDKCQVIGQLQFGPENVETIGGGTSSRILQPVAEAMIQSCSDYTQKGYLGFDEWWPITGYRLKVLNITDPDVQVCGIQVNVNSVSPALSPVSGPALPLGSDAVILEVNGLKVGNGKGHITNVTWFLTAGENVTLKWYLAPDFATVFTTVVTLDPYPAIQDGPGYAELIQPIPPLIPKSTALADALTEVIQTTYPTREPLAVPVRLGRLVASAYADGLNTPSGPTRPNPRAISNDVFAGPGGPGIPNPDALTDFFWLWGQFVDHDCDLSPATSGEAFNIAVPTGDPDFDPGSTGTVVIPLERTDYDPASGITYARQQLNHVTSFVDCTNTYGSTEERRDWLRTFVGGKLKTSPSGDLPPLNDGTQDNATSALGSAPFVVGDVRGNEQTLLLSTHTLLLREHNRWADLIIAQSPNMSDEDIYQKARVMVESIAQHITWYEYLPLLVGESALPAYTGYKPATDTSIANEFSTAAYRLGHSFVSDVFWRLQPNGDQIPLGNLDLKDAFFAPHRFTNEGGIDPLFRGANAHVCQKLDTKIVSGLRNFLFGPPGAGGFDLAALNIQRGRDHGLPDFNTVRSGLGLTPYSTFAEITSDTAVQSALSTAYGGDISLIDLWVGGLAEDHLPGSQLGETFRTIVVDQFTRLRDGDEMWFENRLSPELQAYVKTIKLADVVRNNTNITGTQIRANVMQVLNMP